MTRWKQRMTRAILCLCGIAAGAHLARAELQIDQKTEGEDEGLTLYRLNVTPAAEPLPALRHRLRLRELELHAGNAAPYYYRAMLDLTQKMRAVRKEYGEAYDVWYTTDIALADLPKEQVLAALANFNGNVMPSLREATRRRDCDWEWKIEDIRGPDLFTFVLEEVQQSRELARMLALRTRLALAERRFDDALDEIQMIYRMARDVGQQRLLVCGLVGAAITSVANQHVLELIAQEGSPNLYWALADLQPQQVDLTDSIRFELEIGMRTFPSLIDAEQADHSPEEWARILTQSWTEAVQVLNFSPVHSQAAVAAMAVFAYPGAKQRLIDAGMDAAQVAAMPTGQVIAIDAAREYRRITDDLEKWLYVPYHVARRQQRPDPLADGRPQNGFAGGYGRVIANLLLPAVDAARSADTRIRWQMGALQTIEALRMHAAQTGQWPETLADVKQAPPPNNPATGQPYVYRREGEKAVLDLPFSDGFPGVAWRFELELRPPGHLAR